MFRQIDSARLPVNTFLNLAKKDTLMLDMKTVLAKDKVPIIAALKTTFIRSAALANVKNISFDAAKLTKGNIDKCIIAAFSGDYARLEGVVNVLGCDDRFVTTITVYAREYGKSTFDKCIDFKNEFKNGATVKVIERQGVYKIPTNYTIVVSTNYTAVACFGSDTRAESSVAIRGVGTLFSLIDIAQTDKH